MEVKDHIKALIEALIFVSERPVTIEALVKHFNGDLELDEIKIVIKELQKEYLEFAHGIALVEVASGYQFRTKRALSEEIQRFKKIPVPKLSQSMLEVLSIVAYEGPVTRSGIESVRGVDSSHILRQLIEKKLVRPLTKKDQDQVALEYVTTDNFLELFGLNGMDSLPDIKKLEELVTNNEIGALDVLLKEAAVAESEMEEQDASEYGEVVKKLKDVKADTEFTQFFKKFKRRTEENERNLTTAEILDIVMDKERVTRQNKLAADSYFVTTQQFLNGATIPPEIIEKFDEDDGDAIQEDIEAEELEYSNLEKKEELNLDAIGQEVLGEIDGTEDSNLQNEYLSAEEIEKIDAIPSEILEKFESDGASEELVDNGDSEIEQLIDNIPLGDV